MKGIIAVLLLAVLSGCSTIKINPSTSDAVEYRTSTDGATAQLILSQEFQRTVITQKPSYGKAWGPREFEIAVGRPLSRAIAFDFKSRFQTTRVGDVDDGKPSNVVMIPKVVSLQFGVDDGRAMGFMSGMGLLAAGSEAVVGAKAIVMALVSTEDGSTTEVEVVGTGALTLAYISIDETDVSKAIGMALGDAAQKLGELASKRASLAAK